MSSTTNNKEEDEFHRVRTYILNCPDVPHESKAIQAALAGIDLELKRIERDTKLKRKFSNTSETTTKMENEKLVTDASASNVKEPTTTTTTTTTTPLDNDDELMGEWQDVAQEPRSVLGARLAQLAIGAMAQHQTACRTPIAAIALALHASLTNEVLGFACTGIPQTETSKGFASPIRELPKGQFVPPKWDDSDEIRLRYRKTAVGSVVLQVTLQEQQVQVSLIPTNTSEPPSQPLLFQLEDHVNLESFQKALYKQGHVLPALHYKDLPTLLTNFANTVDMGTIRESPEDLPTFVPPQPIDPLRIPTRDADLPYNPRPDVDLQYNPYETPTIQVFRPARPHQGDFAGDLYPAGNGDFLGDRGNLLGPNHPMFGGQGGLGGGLGMRPRFDPFGPPGGPQDPNNLQPPLGPRRPRPPPGGLGDPNPDHLRPPNNLNNDMFR
jgi:hypothetical protein